MQRRYTVVLLPDPEEGVYTVLVPALPGCVSQGATVDEALLHAREAIEGHIESLMLLGEEIPEEPLPPTIASVQVESRAELSA